MQSKKHKKTNMHSQSKQGKHGIQPNITCIPIFYFSQGYIKIWTPPLYPKCGFQAWYEDDSDDPILDFFTFPSMHLQTQTCKDQKLILLSLNKPTNSNFSSCYFSSIQKFDLIRGNMMKMIYHLLHLNFLWQKTPRATCNEDRC